MEIPATREEFLHLYDRAWTALEQLLGSLSAKEMTEPTDAAGWNVRDHVAHLAAWERSRIPLLRKESVWESMGLTKAEYEDQNFDPANELLRQRSLHLSAEEALQLLRETNQLLLKEVEATPDNVLEMPLRDFHPEFREANPSTTMLKALHGDAGGHFEEHLPWIAAIVGK